MHGLEFDVPNAEHTEISFAIRSIDYSTTIFLQVVMPKVGLPPFGCRLSTLTPPINTKVSIH